MLTIRQIKPYQRRNILLLTLLTLPLLILTLPDRSTSAEKASGPTIRFAYFEDAEANLSIKEIKQHFHENRFVPAKTNRLSAEHSNSALWLGFELPEANRNSDNRYLVIGPGYVDSVALYGDQTEHQPLYSGDAVRFADKPVYHPLQVFELSAKGGLYLVRASSEGILRIHWNIQSQQAFTAANMTRNSWYALLLGVLSSMLIYNFCLYISIRDTTYLYYLTYHLSAAILIYSLAGYAGQYLWPGFTNSTNSIVPIALTGMNLSGLLFANRFLELPRYTPKSARLFQKTVVLLCIMALPGLILPYRSGAPIIYLSSLISVMVIGYGVLISWRAKVPSAKFLIINFFCVVLPGSLASYGYEFGWLPDWFIFSHMLEISTAAETLLLSLFLASRIKLLESEKNLAQEKNLQLQSSFGQKMVAKLEEDRSHIARELHDSIGQTLSLIHINLRSQAEKTNSSPPPMLDQHQTLALLKQTITDIRELSHHLHPSQLGRLGLVTALNSLVQQCRVEGAPEFRVAIAIQEEEIHEQNKIHLYRIVQEAVNNILCHADATLCRIALQKKNDRILLSIQDNGRGFSKIVEQQTGLGLTSMADRADIINAELDVQSEPGEGTTVTVTFKAA